MKKRSIFILVTSGIEERNLLLGKFFSSVEADTSVAWYLFVDPKKHDFLNKTYGRNHVMVCPAPVLTDSLAQRSWRMIMMASIPTETIWARQLFTYKNGGRYVSFLLRRIFWMLGHLSAWRKALRLLDMLLFRQDRVWRDYFDQYHPDVIFTPAMMIDDDAQLAKYARRRGVSVVSLVRSWDNLTSKLFIRVVPDLLLVQNPIMRQEAMQLADIPSARIHVVGFPQWDHYVDPSWRWSKEVLAAKIGADPAKKWVTYFSGPFLTTVLEQQDRGDHIRMAQEALRDRTDIEIIASIHPIAAKHLDASLQGIRTVMPSHDLNFNIIDMQLLMNLIRHSALTINHGSTITLEAAIFDRPIVLLGFNGYQESMVPWQRKLKTTLDHTTHYQYVQRMQGVRRVDSETAFCDALRMYLQHPEYDAEGRRRIVEELVGPLDGNAGVRIYEHIKSLN